MRNYVKLLWKDQGFKIRLTKLKSRFISRGISYFKKQGNYVVKLNKQAKFKYFNFYYSPDSTPFWVNCKPYFSNKCSKVDTDIILNENGNLTLKNEEIAKTFNGYFGAIVDNLNLHHWEDKTSSPSNTSDKIYAIIKNYEKIQAFLISASLYWRSQKDHSRS